MERTFIPCLSLISIIWLLLIQGVLNWLQTSVSNLQKCLLSSQVLVFDELIRRLKDVHHTDNKIIKCSLDLCRELISNHDDVVHVEDEKLVPGAVEIVMKNLRISCNPVDLKFYETLGSDEFSSLFDEDEPSLAEVKEAFDVFDQNGDGFIDAKELQRILHSLGLREGCDFKGCEKMIRVVDENGDGRIDFSEFVKFMENSF